MRDFEIETKKRVEFIQNMIKNAGAAGIVFGSSGGKDSTLVGILCKKACENTVGVIMPASTGSNFADDMSDALTVSELFSIENRTVDIGKTESVIYKALRLQTKISETAKQNIAPRLRMTVLYAIAASENRIVAGTGNKSEWHMGYFTKWGDGAYDFNPIADLTVTEIYEYLKYLGVPDKIINKPPSAGLYDGQTDEKEMGITYKAIDAYLFSGFCTPEEMEILNHYHNTSEHKRKMPVFYGSD